MIDTPHFGDLWRVSSSDTLAINLEVCAVCSKKRENCKSNDVGNVYACLEWGHSFTIVGPLWNKRVSSWKRHVNNIIWSLTITKTINRQKRDGTNEEFILGDGHRANYDFWDIANPPTAKMSEFLNLYFN
ncbi:MAG: hypothetical protein LBC74_06710 [Planctomycetaceae bacterium]|jgi:hypothetical protein|nr:hypothetical protein [Planctomycetaceae bacterium]